MSKIADLEALPTVGSCSVSCEGRNLLIVRQADALHVFENRCPHTQESLDPMGGSVCSEGGLLLECQRHAAQFVATTGECVAGPCLGERLEAVAVVVSQGGIYLD